MAVAVEGASDSGVGKRENEFIDVLIYTCVPCRAEIETSPIKIN